MISAALLYVGIVGLIVALGFGSVGLSYWATKDTMFQPKRTVEPNTFHHVRRG